MKKFAIEIKWALIYSIAMLVWMFIEKMSGLHDQYIDRQLLLTNAFGIIGLLIYFLAIKEKRDKYFRGEMLWVQGFLSGVYLAVFIAILTPVVNYIIYELISPEYFANMIRYYSQADAKFNASSGMFFTLKSYIIQSSMSGLSMGIIASALIALVLRNKKQNL